ncbi:MAG: SGNH/GDSL hydrolase family protein [Myxococcales bacterium]|nr:SGNH/GDSL hydrolase family protein [Myxococcales bacterium]
MRGIWLVVGLALLAGCDDDGGPAADPGQQGQVDAAPADGAADAAPVAEDMAPAVDEGASPEPDAAVADAGPDAAPPPPVGACGPGQVTGWLYTDQDGADETRYAATREADDPPVNRPFEVLTPTGPKAVQPCEDGSYAFTDMEDGPAMVVPPADAGRCSRRNCPRGFAAAVAGGSAVVVTMGDSIPVVGDRPLFPSRLVTLFEGLAEIDSRNVAVAGSTSPEWLPGQPNFERRLRPEMADADLVIISIGGNDILAYMSNPALLANVPMAIAGAKDLVVEIVGRVQLIMQAIREVNPDADILYCLYPDYTQATTHQLWGLAGRLIGAGTMREVLETALAAIPDDEELLVADMLNGFAGLDVGLYLYDALHFNDLGQTRYAEEIFQTLGGVYLGPSPLGGEPRSPLGAEQSYGFVP